MGSNSTIATNIIYNHTVQIAIHTLSNRNRKQHCLWGEIGIELRDKSSDNAVNNNTINNTQYGMYLLDAGSQNKFYSNSINNASVCAILVGSTDGSGDKKIRDQRIIQNKHDWDSQFHCFLSLFMVSKNVLKHSTTTIFL